MKTEVAAKRYKQKLIEKIAILNFLARLTPSPNSRLIKIVAIKNIYCGGAAVEANEVDIKANVWL